MMIDWVSFNVIIMRVSFMVFLIIATGIDVKAFLSYKSTNMEGGNNIV